MSEQPNQANEANRFARKNFGADVDAAAGAAGLKVFTAADGGGGDGGGAEAASRSWVELPGNGHRDVADFARELGAVLADTPIFRREDVIVTVDPVTGDVRPMLKNRFMSWVSDYTVVYEKVEIGRGDKKATLNLRKTMPKTVAECVLEADVFQAQLRPLVRVNTVRMPVMRKDGKPELLPEGYDPESQIYTLKSGVTIDETMTMEKVRHLFAEYYGEFGFTDERSLAVAITIPLAMWGIGLQSVEAARMGFMVRANTQGGGKSLIAQMGITPSYGLPENTAKAKEEELRKILDAAVLQGSPYLFFDNLKGHFENALVEGFMTTPVWRARVMGTQRFMRGKVCSILIITGNNLTVSPDLQRRMLQCDVFVEEFDLQERSHKRDLNPVVLNRPAVRGEFLSALWAMIRNWDKAQRPPAGTRERPFRLATFAEWSDIFGGIVQAAGYGNPLERPKDEEVAAPITLHQRRLVEILSTPADGPKVDEKTPMLEYQFQGLVDTCHENELFAWKMKGKEKTEGDKVWFELASESVSTMGLMFTKEMAGKGAKKRIYTLPDGRRIAFGKQGEGRAKRYTVEFVGMRGSEVEPMKAKV